MNTLLTVRAAADCLGVGYSTLKQWIYDGAVRTVRTNGGHHRITQLEIQRLLLSQAGPASRSTSSVSSAALGKRSAAVQETRLPASAVGVLVALSGRNQLRGVVEEVRGDGLMAQVTLRIGAQRLTAVITRDAITELKLKRGDEAVAIIKSTEVMIGREGKGRSQKGEGRIAVKSPNHKKKPAPKRTRRPEHKDHETAR